MHGGLGRGGVVTELGPQPGQRATLGDVRGCQPSPDEERTSRGVEGEPERGAGRPRRRVGGSCGPVSEWAAEEDPGQRRLRVTKSVSRTRPAGGRRGSREAGGRGDAVPWAPYGPTPGPSL